MYWQVILATEPQSSPAAQWLPEKWTPAPRKQPAPPDANTVDTRSASGSGSKQWEQNFHMVFDKLMQVVHRYPGLSTDIDSVLAELDQPELWN